MSQTSSNHKELFRMLIPFYIPLVKINPTKISVILFFLFEMVKERNQNLFRFHILQNPMILLSLQKFLLQILKCLLYFFLTIILVLQQKILKNINQLLGLTTKKPSVMKQKKSIKSILFKALISIIPKIFFRNQSKNTFKKFLSYSISGFHN